MNDHNQAMYRPTPNNFDAVVLSDNSALDIGSNAQSRKDESISSRLDYLIQCDKSIKQRMEEFDQKFIRNGTNSRISGIEQKKNSVPETEGDNTLLKIASYRQSFLKPISMNSELDKPRARVGHYPNYLEPAITSSNYAKSSLFKKSEDRQASNSSRKLAMKVSKSKDGQYRGTQNNVQDEIKRRASDKKQDDKHHYFSSYNHATPEKFLPKVVSMKIDGHTKGIELLAECRTAEYSTVLSRRSVRQKRCESAGSVKGTRKSLQSASFTTSGIKKDNAPKLCNIIKSIANSDDFKSTHYEHAQSNQLFISRFSRLLRCYQDRPVVARRSS